MVGRSRSPQHPGWEGASQVRGSAPQVRGAHGRGGTFPRGTGRRRDAPPRHGFGAPRATVAPKPSNYDPSLLTSAETVTYGRGASGFGVCYDRGMIDENEVLVLAALTVQDVSAYARILLAVLTMIGDDTDMGRTATCSMRDLARVAGVTRRTVLRSIHALEQAGLLVHTRRTRQDGGSGPSTYTVLTSRLLPEEPR